MSWYFSTGLKDLLWKKRVTIDHAVAASTISFGDGTGTGGRDQVLDSGSGLGSFVVGQELCIVGGTNDGVSGRILSVAAGAIELAAGTLATESAGSQRILVAGTGGSLADIMRNCVAMGYSGSRPASADLAEVGTKLVELTLNGDSFSSGSPTNGLNFDDSGTDLTLGKATDPETDTEEVWTGNGLATAQMQSLWIYANTVVQGASTSAVRMVGRVGISGSGAEAIMPGESTLVTIDQPVTISTVELTIS